MGIDEDLLFGEVNLVKPASKEDMEHGIDAWVGDIPFAWRRRRKPFDKWKQISIRFSRSSGIKTEYEKLLNNKIKALLYVFEFPDALIICSVADIIDCLRKSKFQVVDNLDDKTQVAYIDVANIKHLYIRRT